MRDATELSSSVRLHGRYRREDVSKLKIGLIILVAVRLFSFYCFAGTRACTSPPTCDDAHMCGKADGVCIIQVGADASARGVTNVSSTLGGATMAGTQYVCVANSTVVVFAAAPGMSANFTFSVDTFTPGNPFNGSGSFSGGGSVGCVDGCRHGELIGERLLWVHSQSTRELFVFKSWL